MLITDQSTDYCPTRVAFDHGDVLPVNRYVPVDATTPPDSNYVETGLLAPITPPLPNQFWTPTNITAEFVLWRNNGTGRSARYFIIRPGDTSFFWTESSWIIPDGYQINFVSVVSDYQPSYRGGARALSDLAPCILSTGPGHSQMRIIYLTYVATTNSYTVNAFTLNATFNPNYVSPPIGVQPSTWLDPAVTVPLLALNKNYGEAPGIHVLANPLNYGGKVYRNMVIIAGIKLDTGGVWWRWVFTPILFSADFTYGLVGTPVEQYWGSGYNIYNATGVQFDIVPVAETPTFSSVIFLISCGVKGYDDGYQVSVGATFTYVANTAPTLTLGATPLSTYKNTSLYMCANNSQNPNIFWPVIQYVNGSFPQLNVCAQRLTTSPEILSVVHSQGSASRRPYSVAATYNIWNFAKNAQTNVTGGWTGINAYCKTAATVRNTQFVNLTRCQCYGVGLTSLLYYRFYFDITRRALIFDVTNVATMAPITVTTIARPNLDINTAVHLSTWTDTITYVKPNGSFAFGKAQFSDLGAVVPVGRPSLMEANFNQNTPEPSSPNPDYTPTLSVGEIFRNTPAPIYAQSADTTEYWAYRQVAPNFLFGYVCSPPTNATFSATIVLIELNPTTTTASESNITVHDRRVITLVGKQATNRLVSFNSPVNIRDELVQSELYETVWGVNEADGTTWAIRVVLQASGKWRIFFNAVGKIHPLTSLPFSDNGYGFTFTCIPMPRISSPSVRKRTCFLSSYQPDFAASDSGDSIIGFAVVLGPLSVTTLVTIDCYGVTNPGRAMSGNYEQFFVSTNSALTAPSTVEWVPEGFLFRFNYSQYTSTDPTANRYGFTVFNMRRDPSQLNTSETVPYKAQLCVYSQNFTTGSVLLSADDAVPKPSTLSIAKYPQTLNFELTASTNFCEAPPQLGTLTNRPQQQMAVKLNFNFPFNVIPRAFHPLAAASVNKNCLAICPIRQTAFIGGRPRLFTTDGAGFYTIDIENFETDLFVSHRASNSFNPTTFMYNFFADDESLINRVFGFWNLVWQTYSRVAW